MKLKQKTLDKILNIATAKEIDFLLYCLRFQNNRGVIKGITKDDICSNLGISKTKFYELFISLEEKNIIEVDWSNQNFGYFNFRVLNNVFWTDEDLAEGYINLNAAFLDSKTFRSFTKAEKVICLNLYSGFRKGKTNVIVRTMDTLMRWTGKSKQSVKKYIKSIGKLFKVLIKGSSVEFIVKDIFSQRSSLSENEHYYAHTLRHILKDKKVNIKTINPKDFKNIIDLCKQYSYKYEPLHNVHTISAILECIKHRGKLIPKYINSVINKILDGNAAINSEIYSYI